MFLWGKEGWDFLLHHHSDVTPYCILIQVIFNHIYLCDYCISLSWIKKKSWFIYLTASGLSCGTQNLHCVMWNLTEAQGLPQGLWNLSSPTRDRTWIPCITKQILNHWTTREVPEFSLIVWLYQFYFIDLLPKKKTFLLV